MTNETLKDTAHSLARCFMAGQDDCYKRLESACAGLSVQQAYTLTCMAQVYYNYLCGNLTARQGQKMIERCLDDGGKT